jgi:hypothetical protein
VAIVSHLFEPYEDHNCRRPNRREAVDVRKPGSGRGSNAGSGASAGDYLRRTPLAMTRCVVMAARAAIAEPFF